MNRQAMRTATARKMLGANDSKLALLGGTRRAARQERRLAGPVMRVRSTYRIQRGELKACDIRVEPVDSPDADPGDQTIINVPTTTNANSAVTLVNGLVEGTGPYQRVGRDIKMKSLRITGVARMRSKGTGSGDIFGNCLRMIVVYDESPGPTTPKFDDIFSEINSGGGVVSSVWSQPSLQNGDRFTVLRDRTYYAAPMAAYTGWYVNFVHIDEYIKLKDVRTRYKSSATHMRTANLSTGALYVIWRAEKDDEYTHWNIQENMHSRLRYYDE